MIDVKFHCDGKNHFSKGHLVRAFTYTDYSIQMHNHEFYEVNIVLSGTGTHCIENGRFPVKRGDVFVIPPTVAHAYMNTEGLDVYHILLQKSFVDRNKAETEKVKGFLQLTEIEPFLRGNFFNAFFLHLNQLQLMQLKTELDFIDDEGMFSWSEHSFMKYHTVWKILYWRDSVLGERISADMPLPEKKYEMQIIRVLEYIHKNYSEKITIESLCRMAFLSRSTFLRSFKAVCGMSPIEYLNNYRCKKAFELFNSNDYSKTEIAHSCGFYDLSHMERMLKNTGKTIAKEKYKST